MPKINYLSLADVIALHAIIMERTGFAPAPLRDEGRLESAVMRPRMAAHYEQADMIRQGALLAVGISQAQAFIDGNKRTAVIALDTFLYLNGVVFTGAPLELAKQLETIAEQSTDLRAATERFIEWLRRRVEEL